MKCTLVTSLVHFGGFLRKVRPHFFPLCNIKPRTWPADVWVAMNKLPKAVSLQWCGFSIATTKCKKLCPSVAWLCGNEMYTVVRCKKLCPCNGTPFGYEMYTFYFAGAFWALLDFPEIDEACRLYRRRRPKPRLRCVRQVSSFEATRRSVCESKYVVFLFPYGVVILQMTIVKSHL